MLCSAKCNHHSYPGGVSSQHCGYPEKKNLQAQIHLNVKFEQTWKMYVIFSEAKRAGTICVDTKITGK